MLVLLLVNTILNMLITPLFNAEHKNIQLVYDIVTTSSHDRFGKGLINYTNKLISSFSMSLMF